MLKQQGDEREEGLAGFQVFLVRAPVKVKKMDPNHAKKLHQCYIIMEIAKEVFLKEDNAALCLLGGSGDTAQNVLELKHVH